MDINLKVYPPSGKYRATIYIGTKPSIQSHYKRLSDLRENGHPYSVLNWTSLARFKRHLNNTVPHGAKTCVIIDVPSDDLHQLHELVADQRVIINGHSLKLPHLVVILKDDLSQEQENSVLVRALYEVKRIDKKDPLFLTSKEKIALLEMLRNSIMFRQFSETLTKRPDDLIPELQSVKEKLDKLT